MKNHRTVVTVTHAIHRFLLSDSDVLPEAKVVYTFNTLMTTGEIIALSDTGLYRISIVKEEFT